MFWTPVEQSVFPALAASQTYWPGQYPDWERRTPQQLGLDPAKIQQAKNAIKRVTSYGSIDGLFAAGDVTAGSEESYGTIGAVVAWGSIGGHFSAAVSIAAW